MRPSAASVRRARFTETRLAPIASASPCCAPGSTTVAPDRSAANANHAATRGDDIGEAGTHQLLLPLPQLADEIGQDMAADTRNVVEKAQQLTGEHEPQPSSSRRQPGRGVTAGIQHRDLVHRARRGELAQPQPPTVGRVADGGQRATFDHDEMGRRLAAHGHDAVGFDDPDTRPGRQPPQARLVELREQWNRRQRAQIGHDQQYRLIQRRRCTRL